MTPDFLLCDRCGGKIPQQARTFIGTDRGMDPAGSMETTGFDLDLCAECWAKAVGSISDKGGEGLTAFAVGRALQKWIEHNRSKQLSLNREPANVSR